MHRPFVQNVWRKAGKLTCEYKVIVYFEAGHWYGRGVEFNGAVGGGQLNIRLTVLEKLQLEAEAAQGGLASVSHYVRFNAISKTA